MLSGWEFSRFLNNMEKKKMRNSTQDAIVAILMVILSIAGVLLLIAGLSAIGALVLFLAWNAVVPPVFHGPEVTFWQAWAGTFLIGAVKGLFSVKINKG